MKGQRKVLCGVLIFYSKNSSDYLKYDGVVPKKPLQLKETCCEKYKKGKRCKRCPCFDLDLKTDLTGF